MSQVGADLPEGCMQPARTVLEHALAELRRALVMTGGSVDLRFYMPDVVAPYYVLIGLPYECQDMTHRGFFVDTRESLDAFELAKIALTIVPDRVAEKVRDVAVDAGEVGSPTFGSPTWAALRDYPTRVVPRMLIKTESQTPDTCKARLEYLICTLHKGHDGQHFDASENESFSKGAIAYGAPGNAIEPR